MTRGRDANCWDMCAFPKHFGGAEWSPRNMRQAGGNAAGEALLWAENSAAAGINCRAGEPVGIAEKPGFIGFFVMARGLLS